MEEPKWAVSDMQLDEFWYCYLTLQSRSFPSAPHYDFDDEQYRQQIAGVSFPAAPSPTDIWGLARFVPYFELTSGGELGIPLKHALLRSDPRTVLELAIDICLFFLIRERESVPFESVREKLLALRKFARGYSSIDVAFEIADAIYDFDPKCYCAKNSGMSAHVFPRVLVIATMIASEFGHETDQWRPYAEQLRQHQPQFHSANAPEGLSLAQRLYPIFYYIGRRENNELAKSVVSSRLRTRSLEICSASADTITGIPNALTVGTTHALEYMRRNSIFPAYSVDGAGQFCLPIGSDWLSKRNEERCIAGYGFHSNGEAVYVVDQQPGLTHKRCWKANSEYVPSKSHVSYGLEPHHNVSSYYVTRPDGPHVWPRIK